MTSQHGREQLIYRLYDSGDAKEATITDPAGNAIHISRHYDSGLQANPEKRLLHCQGAKPIPITLDQFLKILDQLERYDAKLPWKRVGNDLEKVFITPPGIISAMCRKPMSPQDL